MAKKKWRQGSNQRRSRWGREPVLAPLAVDPSVKAALNLRLHDQVMDLGIISPADYTASKAAMQPVLAKLAEQSWAIDAWQNSNGSVSVAWEVANFIRLRRLMILTKTRTAAHQALVESLPISEGGVPPGDDGTYEGGLQQFFVREINAKFDILGNQVVATLVTIDEQPSMVAILALDANRSGPRPPNYLRDF